ncbi:MAG: type II toxin-antitoxin system RelE/ParE family toxin [Rubrivivax sp.]
MRRQQADRDIEDTIDHCLTVSAKVAMGFVDALERAFTHIGRAPDTGSPHWAHALDVAGLRSWRCSGYPQVVFYFVFNDRTEIWRVLHGRRDIPSWLDDDPQAGSHLTINEPGPSSARPRLRPAAAP